MDRFIAKDAKLDKYDLTKVSLRDSYISNCSLKGTKLGDCTNATFYNCDLTNADFSKAILTGTTFDDCIIENPKFVSGVEAFARTVYRNVEGFLPVNYAVCLFHLKTETDKLPDGKLKDHITEFIKYAEEHKETCWDDGAKFLEMKGYIDQEMRDFVAQVFKQDPVIYNTYKQRFAGKYDYPTEDL